MWQRFSERSTKIIFYAQEEAVRRGRKGVSSEHLLLGLLRDVKADVCVWPPAPLGSLPAKDFAGSLLYGIDFEALCAEVDRQEALAATPAVKNVSLTASAKKIVDNAYEEAREVNVSDITNEFLLLGLARDQQGLAGQTLAQAGFDLYTARQKVAALYLLAKTGKIHETAKQTFWSRLIAKRTAAVPGEENAP